MVNKIIIASGPVIIEDNQVLLVKHGDDELWKFPGGQVENSEIKKWSNSLEETAVREAKEELGIDIKIVKPLKPMYLTRPNHKDQYVVLIHFLANKTGHIIAGSDITEYQWFPIDTLPNNIAPNIKPVLDSI